MVEKAGTNEMLAADPELICEQEYVEEFYQWAKRIGHYHATEAVDRWRLYRKLITNGDTK